MMTLLKADRNQPLVRLVADLSLIVAVVFTVQSFMDRGKLHALNSQLVARVEDLTVKANVSTVERRENRASIHALEAQVVDLESQVVALKAKIPVE